ncbi:MAG TPA: dihydrolipoamide acetyltransferase family protein [Acidimicrobiales bacterium]|nr:dihydrolipoamide acetyltransferase family protein [Acidimicrobiales bacterium]
MPSLGADMESGTIVEWRVAPGDAVTRGQIVAEVETEKANIEIEIFQTGRIGELLVPVGVEVAVGTPLATVLSRDGQPAPSSDAVVPPSPTAPPTAAPAAPPPHGRVISPLVRRLADKLHVDLDTVEPTGPASTITRSDVERAAESRQDATPRQTSAVPSRPRVSPRARKRAAELGIDLASITPRHAEAPITAADLPAAAAPPSIATAPATHKGLSAAVGRLMERSKREIPHYYVSDDIDMTTSLNWLEQANATRSVQERMLPAALMLRAVVIAAQEAREMNGHFVDGAFGASDAVHLGVAVSLRNGGLIAPVIRDAQTLDLSALMAALREMVARTRSGTLRSTDVEAATITVTNLGDRGAGAVFGVIIPPQVAIVGFGRVSERPWAAGGMVGARPVVTVSLSADHRVSHGHSGARFLNIVARCLSKPEEL